MTKQNILIADDDLELCELLSSYLEGEGFAVSCIHSGAQVVPRLAGQDCDLLILDVMLPDLDGFSALRDLRRSSSVPVLMLTARGDDIDRILGLETGADDYLPKPCNPRELLARARAILRRTAGQSDEDDPAAALNIGNLSLQPRARRALRAGATLDLTSAEFDILRLLMRRAGEVVSREAISREALGRALSAYDRSVDVHISNLRRKLVEAGDERERISAVRGRGYQLTVV